jgi:hypothetical protein
MIAQILPAGTQNIKLISSKQGRLRLTENFMPNSIYAQACPLTRLVFELAGGQDWYLHLMYPT